VFLAGPDPCQLPAGMMDLKGAHEWVVTTKLGSSDVRPGTTPTVTRNCRMYAGEMAMSGAHPLQKKQFFSKRKFLRNHILNHRLRDLN